METFRRDHISAPTVLWHRRKLPENKNHWLNWAERTSKPDRPFELYGRVPIDEFLALDSPVSYEPAISDVISVQQILCKMGFPAELTMDIMDLAGYEPKRRLQIPHDPPHPSNREELSRYLTYCWQIIVRCDMMRKAIGMEVHWQEFVADIIIGFFDYRNARRHGNRRKSWGCWDRDEPLNLAYIFA